VLILIIVFQELVNALDGGPIGGGTGESIFLLYFPGTSRKAKEDESSPQGKEILLSSLHVCSAVGRRGGE
jgi:hypothetical protein